MRASLAASRDRSDAISSLEEAGDVSDVPTMKAYLICPCHGCIAATIFTARCGIRGHGEV